MRISNSLFCHLLLIITLIIKSSHAIQVAVSSFRDLLSDLGDCDLQLMHAKDYENQLSFKDFSLVSTTVFMPTYESVNIYSIYFKPADLPALNTFKARVSPCRLSFIFLGAGNSNLLSNFNHWTKIASNYYLNAEFTGRLNNSYFIPNRDSVITVVTNKSGLALLVEKGLIQPVFNFMLVLVVSPGQNFEMCFSQLAKKAIYLWATIICTSEITSNQGNYVFMVGKQIMRWEEWCILENDPQTTTLPYKTLQYDKTGDSIFTQLALEIFSKTNISFLKDSRCSTIFVRRVQPKFSASNPGKDMDVTLIQTDFEGYQFLTCYAEPYTTLDFYLSPFQQELWIVLGTTIATLIALTTLCQHFFILLEQQPFSPWMFMLASIFEEGCMPTRIEKQTFFRISLGIWCLMSVVLTNGYNGIMIPELISPRRLFHPISFDQLDCNSIFKIVLTYKNKDGINLPSSTKKEIRDAANTWSFVYTSFIFEVYRLSTLVPLNAIKTEKADLNLTNVDISCYGLLSAFEDSSSAFEPSLVKRVVPEFLAMLKNPALAYSRSPSNYSMFSELTLFAPSHAFFPRGFSYLSEDLTESDIQRQIEGEVVQCGKTVFIAKSSKIKLEHKFLSKTYPDIKFFMSEQTVQSYPTGISFQNIWGSLVPNTFKSLNEAGILSHKETQKLSQKNINRTAAIIMETSKDFNPTNTTIRGAWPTVFILAGTLISVSIPIFIIECRRHIGPLLGFMRHKFSFRHYRKSRRVAVKSVINVAVALCEIGKNN